MITPPDTEAEFTLPVPATGWVVILLGLACVVSGIMALAHYLYPALG